MPFKLPEGHTFACKVCGHVFPVAPEVTIGVVVAHMETEHPEEFIPHKLEVDLVPIPAQQ